MTKPGSSTEPSLEALLEMGQRLPRLPDAVRQRVLARASAASVLSMPSLPRDAGVAPARSSRHVAMAAAAALAGALAGTVYALDGGGAAPGSVPPSVRIATRAARSSEDSPPAAGSGPGAPVRSAPTAAPRREETAALPEGERHARRARPTGPGDETYDAELGLMRSAHNAYASHEFANALVLVSEHARRFPRGILAEEREALRVRCLLAAGRAVEAQRAAADFLRRFPRSVLVPRIQAELRGSSD